MKGTRLGRSLYNILSILILTNYDFEIQIVQISMSRASVKNYFLKCIDLDISKKSYKCLYICTDPSQILKESYEDKTKLLCSKIGKNKNILLYVSQHIHQEIQRPLNLKFSVVIL